MRKQAALLPSFFTDRSLSAKASEDSSVPSGVSTQNHAPLGTAAKIRSASAASPAAISDGLGSSGRRLSGSSTSRNLQ